ncbi:MAG: glycosyltransferase family 39 protein [Pseudonocardiaceae bacterium]
MVALTTAAAALYGWGIAHGAVHYYYGAAVRSMSASWHNMAFGAFDPGGFISVDKLPGAFWIQALFVRTLGFHRWVVLLPQALAATVTVQLLYATVRRWRGHRAAVLAALTLLATPVTYAVVRVNLPDTLLVLCLVAAAYTTTRAVADGSRRWLVGSGVLLGLGFQVKMLEALLVLPAVLTASLVAVAGPTRTKWARAALLVVVTVGVSLSWMLVVTAVPANDRPHVDGSATNSVWDMVFGFNGIHRVTGSTPLPFGGPPDPLRLLINPVGGQIGWLLPLALLSLAFAFPGCRGAGRAAIAGWVLWGGWLVTAVLVFSAAPGIHPYYTVLLAPAVAAVSGAGLDQLLTGARRGTALRWCLPIAVTGTVIWGLVLGARAPGAIDWLAPLLIMFSTLLMLSLARATPRFRAVMTTVAVLAAPAAWITLTPPLTANSMSTVNPAAGPAAPEVVFGSPNPAVALTLMFGMPPGGPPPTASTPLPGTRIDHLLLHYLRSHQNDERYLFATADASSAAPYVAAGIPVLPMGGFTASTPAPTLFELATLVRSGDLRFVWMVVTPGAPGPLGARSRWVLNHCAVVAPGRYREFAEPAAARWAPALYDCQVTPSGE